MLYPSPPGLLGAHENVLQKLPSPLRAVEIISVGLVEMLINPYRKHEMFFIGVVYITIKMKTAKWCNTFKIGKR